MYDFNIILKRIKEVSGKSKNKEIAELLGTNENNFSRWVGRNKIPYEQITTYCHINNIDLMYILTGKQTNTTNNQNIKNQNGINIQGNNNKNFFNENIEEKEKSIINAFRKLNEERKQYYYFKINAEALED